MFPSKMSRSGPSNSKELVPRGSRHLSSRVLHKTGVRDAQGNKPSTTRALVLRNGKHGVRGTQELVLVGKMSGREKLQLLAGEICLLHVIAYHPLTVSQRIL